MNPTGQIDYLTLIDQLRQEEQGQQSQIHAPDYIPHKPDEPVDYLVISKIWEIEKAGKYMIHLQTGKRNPSHDPIYRRAENESAF